MRKSCSLSITTITIFPIEMRTHRDSFDAAFYIRFFILGRFRLISLFSSSVCMVGTSCCFTPLQQIAQCNVGHYTNLCMHSLMNECICDATVTVGVIFFSNIKLTHLTCENRRISDARTILIQFLYFNENTTRWWLLTFTSIYLKQNRTWNWRQFRSC